MGGTAGVLSSITCATGYYHYNNYQTGAAAATAKSLSTCAACPANAYSCTPGSTASTGSFLDATSTVICNSGYTLIGSPATVSAINGNSHSLQCVTPSTTFTVTGITGSSTATLNANSNLAPGAVSSTITGCS